MFEFVYCLVNMALYAVHGCCIVDWWVDISTGVLISPQWISNCNAAALLPKGTYGTTRYCKEVYKYYTTKAPKFNTITYTARATTPWSITLPRVTTPPRRRSTTWLRMLPHPTTPRLRSITLFSATYCTDFPKYYSVPSYTEAPADYSTKNGRILHRSGKVLLCPDLHNHNWGGQGWRCPDFYTKAALSYYVEQKHNTDAPVYYTTTYATPQPRSTTPKKLPYPTTFAA